MSDLQENNEGSVAVSNPLRPRKRFYRSRAHCNPLSHNDSFNYPLNPQCYDWSPHYPNILEENRIVRILDMGMGFGGLSVAMAELFPDKLVLGMEIRARVRPLMFVLILFLIVFVGL
jgi:tRNA (guanine-N7-)-methyltransferase